MRSFFFFVRVAMVGLRNSVNFAKVGVQLIELYCLGLVRIH